MSRMNPDRRETEGQASNHPLEPLVAKSIQRLERLFAADRHPNAPQDARDLLSWWKEAKALVDLYTPGFSLPKRFVSAFAQHSLSPLFEPNLTERQFKSLTGAFAQHYREIKEFVERFSRGSGLETKDSTVLAELKAAVDGDMRTLYSRVYVPGSRNR